MRFPATSLVTSTLGLCLSLSFTAPVLADPLQDALTRAVDQHATPAVARFDQAATALSDAAAADCTPEAVKPAYNAAFDAWMGLQHLHMGPLETNGRILAIAFWPDKKGLIPRALADLIAAKDPVVQDPQAFSQVSIAARGFFALEYMLYDDAFEDYAAGSYSCELVQAITHDLGRMAQVIDAEWTAPDGFADTLREAGAAAKPHYFTPQESVQALYTMLMSGLENTKDQRIARPIGTFDKPRPTRAEAYRSGRSERNVVLSLSAARDLARAMAPGDMSDSEEIFAEVIGLAEALDDPDFSGVVDPVQRLKTEIVGQRIEALLGALANDVGLPLGVSAGFNASDGD